jgi:gamma-glutamylcyclotransferase (GGCT)/AIG2-like uncharacterized protein YtfP
VTAPADTYLFVYGTLRSDLGAPAARRLLAGRTRCLGAAHVAGRLHDCGAYPAVVPSPDPAHHVAGELHALAPADADALLAALDAYEGCAPYARPALFRRARTTATLADGGAVEAWIYLYARPAHALPCIASGDYAERVGARRRP